MKNRRFIPVLCLSALLTGGVIYGAAAVAYGAETDYTQAYDEVFKLPADHIQSVTNNGGKYGSSDLKYLTDGDITTHWETGKPNSSTFKNQVIFTFDQAVELGSVVYYPRKTGAANKGFPTQYSVYASDSVSGDDFRLVTQGSARVAAGATKIEFGADTFRRLKFVFDNANQNWAAGAEMMFYYPDSIPGRVNDLFTDKTMSALKEEYQDTQFLEQFLEELQDYPDSAMVQKVQTALDIQTGAMDYAAQVFTADQRGNGGAHSQNVLRTGGYGSNLLPTGYAALAGEQIKVYVDVDDDAPMPSIVFAQQVGKWSSWSKSFALKPGENVFTVPKIYNENWATKVIPGGPIYITNPYTPQQQGSAPRIRIEGGQRYPVFYDGDDEGEFLQILGEYRKKLQENPAATVDIVELCSDKILITGNMKAASVYLDSGVHPQDAIDSHNSSQDEIFRFAGIDESSFINSRNGARVNLRLMQPYGAAYAASGHVGIQQGSANAFFKGSSKDWLYVHEIGHLMDTREGSIGEVTNNMWSNHFRVDIQNGKDRVEYGKIFSVQAPDDYQERLESFGKMGPFWELGMFWQLHLLDENYWARYQTAYREHLLKDFGLTKSERMAVISCYAVGMDVIDHFERYKFVQRNEKIDQALETLGIPKAERTLKTWYLWTKAGQDRTSYFTQDYTPEITGITKSGSTFTLTAHIEESAGQALLGYEVLEDGKVLGFTSGNSFTGTYTDDGQEHSYTVRAYDLRLNASQESQAKEVNFRAPTLKITGSTLIPLRGEFQPLSIVEASSYDGADLSAGIRVISNSVDTGNRGTYQVVYEVADQEGHTSALTAEIQVVSTFTYLSDLEEASASVGYGSFRKDKSVNGGTITLLQNQVPVTFEKGLGAHASSKVVYHLDGKYAYFESFVGIDQSMRGQQAANAKFRVVADGTVLYESKAMKADTDAEYIKLDITNVNVLELITDSNGSNANDHTVWGGARVAQTNSAPVIHARNATFLDPESVNLSEIISSVTAEDVEDGDLTGAITYETNFQEGKTGSFDITYQVSDSDGNLVRVTKKIVVVNDYIYASDTDWKRAKVGWGQIQKDRSLNGKTISLASQEGVRTYEKGIGVHAYSEVVYDLTDKDYYYFTSDAGVDYTAGNGNSSVTFEIYVDGVLAESTPVMRKNSPAVQFCVDISNAKELKLVVTAGGNGNGNDHANWADAKFLTAVQESDKDQLAMLLQEIRGLNSQEYTPETWAVLELAVMQAQELLDRKNATQEETDQQTAALQEALDQLKALIDTKELEEVLSFAEKITGLEYIDPALNHREERLYNVVQASKEYRMVLENAASQKEADQAAAALVYFISETGQTYEPDKDPVLFDVQTAVDPFGDLNEQAGQQEDGEILDIQPDDGQEDTQDLVTDVIQNETEVQNPQETFEQPAPQTLDSDPFGDSALPEMVLDAAGSEGLEAVF